MDKGGFETVKVAGALSARGKACGFVLFERVFFQSELLAFQGKSTILMTKGKNNLLGISPLPLERTVCPITDLILSMFKNWHTLIYPFASCDSITLTARGEAATQRQRAQNSHNSICPTT